MIKMTFGWYELFSTKSTSKSERFIEKIYGTLGELRDRPEGVPLELLTQDYEE
jgi:hypothetical protein